jgi:EmrB/QacA subfamily drug resistance transporter
MTPDAQGYLSHRQILVVMGGLITGMFLASLDQSIVSTALPTITSDLGGLDHLSWVVTSYLLASTASTPLWGKISDLYGRRPIFQLAIITFVVGSVLSGLSGSMEQLIAFRAVQGLGGGGLMALALATIGDVVPPRERPRYQGYIAATFGVSSVLGPVLGGFFADGPGWEWIFFVNVPIGLVALAVTSAALKMPHVRREHSIDYLGAAVIVGSVSALLLYTAWAGPEHGWGDPLSLGLLGTGLVLAALFVVVELRATEPIIPMRLFRNSIYSVSNAFGFLIGAAMFGVMVFIPVYLQLAKGMSPTESGLGMLPMLVGLFTTSILGGRRMSRTGRYKWYPPAGASVVLVAVVLMTQLEADSPYWFAGLAMLVMGLGLGLTMQVLTVAVQNSVDRSEMGVATSSVQFFRQMGGSFGTALFGAVLSVRLTSELGQVDGGGEAAVPDSVKADLTSNMAVVERLPAQAQALVTDAFSDALSGTFLVAVPLVVLALLVGLLLKEIPLVERDAPPATAPQQGSGPQRVEEPVGDVRVVAGEEPRRHEEVVAVDDHGR